MPSAGGRQQTIAIVRQLIPTPGNMLVGADQGKVSFIQVSCLRRNQSVGQSAESGALPQPFANRRHPVRFAAGIGA